MKAPTPPKKPIKPNKPKETVENNIVVNLDDYCYSDKNLSDVLNEKFQGISLEDIKIEDIEYPDSYDTCWKSSLVYRRQAPNPKYDEQMTKYHKKLEEYEEARRQYKIQVEEYKVALQKWHSDELDRLEDG